MDDLIRKYNTMSPELQKEVNDFVDFIINKSKRDKTFDMKIWKNKIKNLSTWTKEDIKEYEYGRKQFKQWKIEEW